MCFSSFKRIALQSEMPDEQKEDSARPSTRPFGPGEYMGCPGNGMPGASFYFWERICSPALPVRSSDGAGASDFRDFSDLSPAKENRTGSRWTLLFSSSSLQSLPYRLYQPRLFV
jgi:hypothetical protein